MSDEPRVLSGRYRIDDLIGRGGMASVYRGYDQTLGRDVAVKILSRQHANDSTFRTRFRLEAQAASRMAHPSIVRVYDAGEDVETDSTGSHPVPYIVMELVEGTLLRDIVASGPVPPAEAVRYVDGILEALEYSHRAGVIHRDIKPGNVMITPAGQVKVMDFGIARAVSDSSSTVAETTAIIGTAAYLSPEQAKGDSVDARADIYSTGIVLYELLTGRPPFRGDSPVAVAYQHVSETPVAPSKMNEQLPATLDPVALRALAKDPYQRFPDAASFREALDDALDGREPTKRQLSALTNELYGPNPRQAAETARSLRQLSADNTMTRTQSGPPVAWIWAAIALIAVLLISVVFWVVTIQPLSSVPANARIVPEVSGMSFDRASSDLESEDLLPVRVNRPSSSVEEGVVIGTQPAEGESVAVDQEIRVFVSQGQQMATVPEIVGMSEQDARAALEAEGLRLGSVVPRNDPELAAGTVMSVTNVSEGEEIAPSRSVNIEVATGRVTVEDYSGATVEFATGELEALGLTVSRVDDPNCVGTDPPTVAAQSVVSEAEIHSTVELHVCTGEEE